MQAGATIRYVPSKRLLHYEVYANSTWYNMFPPTTDKINTRGRQPMGTGKTLWIATRTFNGGNY